MTMTCRSELEIIKKNIDALCNEYQGKLSIDPFSLDKDCAEQPELYFEVVRGYSEIYCFVQRLKLQSKSLRSFTALSVRKDPEKYGYPKVTESLIGELVESDAEIIITEEALIEANGLSILAKGLLDAFEHRRSMLNNSVQLSLSSIGSEVGNIRIKDYGKALEQGKTRSGFEKTKNTRPSKVETPQSSTIPRRIRRHIPHGNR